MKKLYWTDVHGSKNAHSRLRKPVSDENKESEPEKRAYQAPCPVFLFLRKSQAFSTIPTPR